MQEEGVIEKYLPLVNTRATTTRLAEPTITSTFLVTLRFEWALTIFLTVARGYNFCPAAILFRIERCGVTCLGGCVPISRSTSRDPALTRLINKADKNNTNKAAPPEYPSNRNHAEFLRAFDSEPLHRTLPSFSIKTQFPQGHSTTRLLQNTPHFRFSGYK